MDPTNLISKYNQILGGGNVNATQAQTKPQVQRPVSDKDISIFAK